jgi:hypothetical protein
VAEKQTLETLLSKLDQLVSTVESQLTALVGDSSLCLVSQSGRPLNAVKYNEGQYYALKSAKRLLEPKMDQGRGADIPSTLKQAAQKSKQFLSHYQSMTAGLS